MISPLTYEHQGVHITDLDHPAITICKKSGIYDPSEYLRAVFNNFRLACPSGRNKDCEGTWPLRRDFARYADLVYDRREMQGRTQTDVIVKVITAEATCRVFIV